jgi:hypothetical protein
MVNMGVAVGLKSRCDEIHGGFEGTLFGLTVMRPIRGKSGFAIIGSDEPKEVFEAAAFGEQRTLHIEKDVPASGRGRRAKPLPSTSGSVST